jgi:hypothetical protein
MDIQTILALLARHGLTTVGGWLLYDGFLVAPGGTGTTVEQFVSAGMVIGGVLWSIYQKKGQTWILAELVKLKTQKAPTTAAAVQRAMDANKP